jgi:hypothetical protein
MICYVMLCYVMLCYVMLCYVVMLRYVYTVLKEEKQLTSVGKVEQSSGCKRCLNFRGAVISWI